jgi:hypothetical protein
MKGKDIMRIYGVRELVPPALKLEPEGLYTLKIENGNDGNYLKIFDNQELIYLCKHSAII